jgi:hypothetical protein
MSDFLRSLTEIKFHYFNTRKTKRVEDEKTRYQ